MGAGMGRGGKAVAGEVPQGFREDAFVGGIGGGLADTAAEACAGRRIVVGSAERHRGAESAHDHGAGAFPGSGKADGHG